MEQVLFRVQSNFRAPTRSIKSYTVPHTNTWYESRIRGNFTGVPNVARRFKRFPFQNGFGCSTAKFKHHIKLRKHRVPLTTSLHVSNGFSHDSQAESSRVVVVTSGKGGVGKSTTCVNLALSVAQQGYKVAVIDADIGLRNLDLLFGLEENIMFTGAQVLEGHCHLEQALIRDSRWPNLVLLVVARNSDKFNVQKHTLEDLVGLLSVMGFDYVFLDCPAGVDLGFLQAIQPANEAVVVTTPEITAIRAADRVVGLLETSGIEDIHLLVNRVHKNMIDEKYMMSVETIESLLGIPLLGSIPDESEVIVATNRGEPLVSQQHMPLSGQEFDKAGYRLVALEQYTKLGRVKQEAAQASSEDREGLERRPVVH